MNYWLVKADPENDYSIDDLVKDETTLWDGVHNFQAIGFIKQWRLNDQIFIYHSQKEKKIVGTARVVSKPILNEADPRVSWTAKIKIEKKFNQPISLAEIKANPVNKDFLLVRNPRLSVMPIPPETLNWLEELNQ